MHSKSSLFQDNAHMAVYKTFSKAMEKKGEAHPYYCANCHTPMAKNLESLISGKAEPNKNEWQQVEGVGCALCHRIEGIVEGERFNTNKINRDGTIYVSTPSNRVAHKILESKIFATGEVCNGCHSHLKNPKGVSICVMKEEGGGNCLTCHMEKVDGPPSEHSKKKTHISHLMAGGHDMNMLRRAVDINTEFSTDKRQLIVEVRNNITHTFPSTNPMRIAFLKIQAFGKDGNMIWSNFVKTPMEDKRSLFFKAFKAGDKIGVPAWEAEGVAFDTRLKGGEERRVTYDLPSEDIKKITVALIYRLFPPKAIKIMGIPRDGINDKNYIVLKKELIF